MKKIIYTIAIFAFTLASCTTDFEEINTNPNAPVSVQPSLLLRQVIYNFGENMSFEGFVAGDLLAQHRTALDFNLFDRHDLKSPQLGGNPWPIFYTNLRDNEIILKQAQTTPAFAVYEGPAYILKAYMAAGLTDLFGDVPYFEAFNGINGTVTPVYDLQEDIYQNEKGILDNLDKGIAAINAYEGSIPLDGDILYNGNLNAWVQFANSLKIKYLIRISGKVDVSAKLQALFAADNYIKSNSENAVFDFTNSEPNSFRLAQLRVGDFNNFVLSETMEEILNQLNDDRINTFFRPFANSTSNEFNGLLNGIDASSTSIALSDFSLSGTAFREDTSSLDANFITAWETNFLLAEAAEKGFITASAATLYNLGVAQAFEYWNTNLPTSYLETNANYNAIGTTPLEQIATQKWIASVINGYEGWIEFRRTGFPVLKNVSASLNGGAIPVRMPYPAEAASLNSENYKAAETATNGNSLDVKFGGTNNMDVINWQWLLVIGSSLTLFFLSPLAKTTDQFFKAVHKKKAPNTLVLTGSLIISWIFAKSITNAANLGLEFGLVGGVAYAGYYLSFAVAGIIIYQLRTKGGFKSIHEFLTSKFGKKAMAVFSVLIAFRLFNEVWSNTMVIGSYFGAQGSSNYYWAIIVFTLLTLSYALKGGLSSSIFTDVIQMVLFSILLLIILGTVFTTEDFSSETIITSGTWSFELGLNLFFAALIQSFSYPFHDPVLTDRGFISSPKVTRKSFLWASLLGAVCIVLFSLIGVYAQTKGMSGQAAVEVGKAFGVVILLVINFIMITSAASTLDSTFSSFSKLIAIDLKLGSSVSFGRITMVVVAVLGTIPVFLNAEILSATTISGTMVIGLTPIFIFWKVKVPTISFYLSVFCGLIFGFFLIFNIFPAALIFTEGRYASLLWVNVWGIFSCIILYFIPKWIRK